MFLAQEMLLQIALQDIGQLTDIEAKLSRRGGGSRANWPLESRQSR